MTELTPDQRRAAESMRVWVVWYEDRFGWGPDRDPASPVAAFRTEVEARDYVEANEGEHDIPAGKFDGLFIQEWELLRAVERGVVKGARAIELLAQSPTSPE